MCVTWANSGVLATMFSCTLRDEPGLAHLLGEDIVFIAKVAEGRLKLKLSFGLGS